MSESLSKQANLAALLLELAQTHPERAAIIGQHGQTVTFGELALEARRLAAVLGERGAKTGQRVLVLIPMSAELYITLAALWSVGLVAVVVDPGAGLGHLRRCLRRVKPQGVIAVPAAFPLLLLPELLSVKWRVRLGGWWPGTLSWHAKPTLPPARAALNVAANHPALITFTSGSTGTPKAAVRTHGFLRQQHRVLAHHLGYDDADGGVDLATLAVVSLASLASGRTILLPDTKLRRPAEIDTARVLHQLGHTPAQTVAASPALLHVLAEAALKVGQPLPFTAIFAGGGPVFPRTQTLLAQASPHAQVVSVYGSTEAEPISHMNWDEVTTADLERTKAGFGLLAGYPVPELEVMIVPATAGPLPYPDGAALRQAALGTEQPGEVLVSGAHVLPGYLDGVGDSETKWRDPHTGQIWHRTGDAAQWDEEGRLWLLGRTSARVQDALGTLYPFAVEAAAMTHPKVKRAALLPGQRLLIIESDEDVQDEVKLQVAWANLREVRRVRHIPVDARHNAKVDYVQLRRLLQE